MKRLSLALALVALSCRRDAPRPLPRHEAPRPMAPPLEDPVPAAPPFGQIPGHAMDDAGIAPAPDPSAGPLIGWDLVPLEDGFGRDDVAWLVLTERVPGEAPRDLVNVGARGGCRELAPPMLHDLRDGGAGLVGGARAVRCELPEPVNFSLAREGDAWVVLRSGCVQPSRACPHPMAPDAVVGSVAVASDVRARTAGPLTRREQAMPIPQPSEPLGPREVRLRWELGAAVRDGTPLAARALSLVIEGAVSRRIDFGAGTAIHAPTEAERSGAEFVRGAVSAAVLDTADEGARGVSITRQDDVLRVHVSSFDRAQGERPVIISQRVGLPRATILRQDARGGD